MASQAKVQAEVVVIGAGPAGLAVAACLHQEGIACTLLEQSSQVASSWRRHYERLHLHTDRRHSGLPFMPMPASYPRYPSRQQVIAYLEAYAQHFDIAPRFHERVSRVRRSPKGWQVTTQNAQYEARCLVVATGYAQQPSCPAIPHQEAFVGEVLHSSRYQTATPYKGKRVLVVGLGNSGGEIALGLLEHGAQPSLSPRGPVNVIPRDFAGIPLLAAAIPLSYLPPHLADALTRPVLALRYGDLSKHGLQRLPYGPFTQVQRDVHIPLIDTGVIAGIKKGAIRVYPQIARFHEDGVEFADGSRHTFEAVILATGFRPDLSFLPASAPKGEQNLYFCGFHVTAGGVLREIGLEAQSIARQIAGQLEKQGNGISPVLAG